MNNDIFFTDVIACRCGYKISMQTEIGFQEGIFSVECPKCGSVARVYANLEVSYTILPHTDNFSLASILEAANKQEVQ